MDLLLLDPKINRFHIPLSKIKYFDPNSIHSVETEQEKKKAYMDLIFHGKASDAIPSSD